MTTPNEPIESEAVSVSERAREAAAAFYDCEAFADLAQGIRDGHMDTDRHSLVQAFARFERALTASPSGDLVEAATKARDTFLHYEDLHRLKCTPEGDEKADRNREMADALTAALRATPSPPVEGVEQLRIGQAVEVVAENLPKQWAGDWADSGIFYVARIEASGDSINYTISDTWPIKRGFHGASELTDGFEPNQLRATPSPLATDDRGGEELVRYRHNARGTEYDLIGTAELQDARGDGVEEGALLAIYRGDDGKFWARRQSEFGDGRFTKITTLSATDGEDTGNG